MWNYPIGGMAMLAHVRFPFFVALFLAHAAGQAQTSNARADAMGQTRLCIESPWGAIGHAASMKSGVAFGASNQFLIPELTTSSFALSTGLSKSQLGLGGSFFSFMDYRQSLASVAYSIALMDKLKLGFGGHYITKTFADPLLRERQLGASFSFLIFPTDQVKLAGQIQNLSSYVFSDAEIALKNEDSKPLVELGASYEEKSFLLTFQTRVSAKASTVHLGAEVRMHGLLSLRFGGIYKEELVYSFGLGLKLRKLQVDLASWRHPALGFSSSFSASYSWGK